MEISKCFTSVLFPYLECRFYTFTNTSRSSPSLCLQDSSYPSRQDRMLPCKASKLCEESFFSMTVGMLCKYDSSTFTSQ